MHYAHIEHAYTTGGPTDPRAPRGILIVVHACTMRIQHAYTMGGQTDPRTSEACELGCLIFSGNDFCGLLENMGLRLLHGRGALPCSKTSRSKFGLYSTISNFTVQDMFFFELVQSYNVIYSYNINP